MVYSDRRCDVENLLAHPVYGWMGAVGAKITALTGIVSAVRKKDIMGMDADDWFQLSTLYMIFVVVFLLARLIKQGK
ncbi:MAG: hypothetical protein V1748_02475 [Actinomycetota bacterium]